MAVGCRVMEAIERFGRVVDASGAPVPQAHIVIVAGSVPMPEIALLTDDAGRFSLRLPPGVFTLRAHGPAGTGEAEIEVDGGQTEHEVVIAIGR
jgi:hypothetical protein